MPLQLLIICLGVLLTSSGYVRATPIIACEQAQGRLLLIDEASNWNDAQSILWSWSPDGSPDIPQQHVPWFINFSDAKSVLDETHVLATASGGAVILIRLEDKKVHFYAHAGVNPHSAEILPDGNIISASSTDNMLRIFSTDASVTSFPDSVYSQDYTLPSAHGVVWDRARTCVWAVGYQTIRRYSYNFDRQKPMLQEEAVFELPEKGGHDLFPTWDSNALMITTHSKIWSFDPVEQTFSPYPLLSEAVRVKSISERSQKPTTVYMQACESWWCDTIRFAGSSKTNQREGARFYKIRWWLPNHFSYETKR